MFLPLVSKASNECFQKPPWVLLIIDAPSDQEERPPKWKKLLDPAEKWVCVAVVPNASTSSLAHAFALSAHTRMSVSITSATYLWLLPRTLLLLPGAGGPLTQTNLSASLWSNINMTSRTKRIRDLTPYTILTLWAGWPGVSWGSFLMVPLRMLTYCQLITKRIHLDKGYQ